MDKFIYDQPTEADILFLAENMRQEDRKELIGAVGYDILGEVRRCVEKSERCWVCRHDGTLLAAFGVIRTNPFKNHGIIWMLATKYTAAHKVYTGKWTRKGIEALRKDWEYLYNYVDEGNHNTIAWLRWIGAKIHPAAPYGIYGNPYHLFTFEEE